MIDLHEGILGEFCERTRVEYVGMHVRSHKENLDPVAQHAANRRYRAKLRKNPVVYAWHLAQDRARKKRTYGRARPLRCGKCGREGHNRRTCT